MKALARRERIRPQAVPTVKFRAASGTDEVPDVSWHEEEVRARMLWGELLSTDYGVEPESAEEG
jgi:hypothetical protein